MKVQKLSTVAWINRHLKIIDKNSQIISLSPNIGQMMLQNTIELQVGRNLPVRIILLKPRQVGWSTWSQALGFEYANRNKNVTVQAVSADAESTDHIFRMSKFFQEKMPDDIRLATKASNKKEIVFAAPHRSRIITQTAGKDALGIGTTVKFFHGCLHKDTPVLLSNGSSKCVKNIEVGDEVVDQSGSRTEVVNKIYIGRKSTISVKTWLTNEEISLTPEHKVLTDSGYKKCGNLSKDDYIRLPSCKFSGKLKNIYINVPLSKRPQGGGAKRVESAIVPLNYDFGYFLGYYLAEGHLKKGYKNICSSTTFAYHKDETFVKKAAIFAKKFATSRKDWSRKNTNTGITVFQGTFLAELIRFCCGRTTGKHIPDFIFDAPKEFGKGILDGIIDGDGSKTQSDKISITTIYENIARQLKRIIIALDYGVPSVHLQTNRYRYFVKTKDVYLVVLNGDVRRSQKDLKCNLNKMAVDRAIKYKKIKGNYYVRIKTVKPSCYVDVYDIEVKSKFHNFELPIGIVSNSEVAKWPNDKKGLAAAFQQIPNKADTFIILESTANGVGGAFYEMFWEAVERLRDNPEDYSGYLPVFFPWHRFPEYSVETEPFEMNEKELELKKVYKLTDGQIMWRRVKLAELRGDEALFCEQYPLTAQEAFQSSGNPVFSMPVIDFQSRKINRDIKYGLFTKDKAGRIKLEPVNRTSNCWQVAYFPDKEHQYTMGIDAMEGRVSDSSDDKSSLDYHGTSVFDRNALRYSCIYKGRGNQQELGNQCLLAAEFYNNAFVGPEVPTGLIVLNVFKNAGYQNLYNRQIHDDQYVEEDSDTLGWRTTSVTRKWLVEQFLVSLQEDPPILVIFEDILSEMRSFIRNKDGKPIHASGKHDDVLISAMIALQLHLRCPMDSIAYPFTTTGIYSSIERQKDLNDMGVVDLGLADEYYETENLILGTTM